VLLAVIAGVAFVINALFDTSGLRAGGACPKHRTAVASKIAREAVDFTLSILEEASGVEKGKTEIFFLLSCLPD